MQDEERTEQEKQRLQDKLLRQIIVQNDTGCWVWQGQISNAGHGRTKMRDENGFLKMASAETASYRAFIGEVPSGSLAVQTCGNRLCINPAHLTAKKFG